MSGQGHAKVGPWRAKLTSSYASPSSGAPRAGAWPSRGKIQRVCGTRKVALVARKSWALVSALVVIGSFARLTATNDPIRVDGGLIADVPADVNGVRAFAGIPYAAPPIGNLRWRPPQAVVPWDGVRRADTASHTCVQMGYQKGSYYQLEFYREPAPTSEDCLYLNVWTPAHVAGEHRPVLVWFHGGGFSQGAGSTPSQGGDGLARKGLVVVTFNYRLGVFGLLAHPELTKESPHHASGNYFLMDQLAALKWVQKNIATFGGDPRRVTIFGQSAGSMSGALLLTSPLAKDLFVGVVGSSGSFSERNLTLHEAEQQGAQLGQKIGATTLSALRAMPADRLLQSSDRELRPVVDGYVVPEDPYAVFARGKQINVPVLLGSNANERGNYPQPKDLQEYRQFTERQYPQAVEDTMNVFPARSDEDATNTYLIRQRDAMAAGMHIWAKRMSATGTPAYLYFFNRKPPARSGETPLGAVHTAEIVYFRNMLDTVDRPWTSADRTLADVMSSYLANFATTGDPNRDGRPTWPRYTPDSVMDLGDHVGPIATPDRRELTWFEEYFAKQHARVSRGSGVEGKPRRNPQTK
jgi:para-nitrobenzyl esterase